MAPQCFSEILNTLASHDVEFIVVGGVASVIAGAPLCTWDLDLVPAADPENSRRLEQALLTIEARPAAGHRPLDTQFGPLDVLGAIGTGRTYEDLLPHTEIVEINPGLRVRVLDMETQIAVKEETGRDKDIAVLPILRRTLIESRRLKEG